MNLAQLDFRDGKAGAARKRLEGVLQSDPQNLDAMLALAHLATSTGDDAETVQWLEKAADAHPNALQPRQLLVVHFLKKGEKQKALAAAQNAQASQPNNPEALDLLGQVQLAIGDKSGALSSYHRLVQLAPKSPVAQYRLALAQTASNSFDDAKVSLGRAVELKRDFLEAQVRLASLEIQTGDATQGLEVARAIQAQHPAEAAGFILEGDALFAEKHYAAAGQMYEKAFGMAKKSFVAEKMYRALQQGGEEKKAQAGLRSAVGLLTEDRKIDPGSADPALELAKLQWLAGSREEAVATASAARQAHPQDARFIQLVAEFNQRLGKNDAAVAAFTSLLKAEPYSVFALNNLAWLLRKCNPALALKYAQKAHRLAASRAAVTDTLGWILLEQGQTDRALELLTAAAATTPGNPATRYHYAVALERVGKRQEAEQLLAELVTKRFPQQGDAKALLEKIRKR